MGGEGTLPPGTHASCYPRSHSLSAAGRSRPAVRKFRAARANPTSSPVLAAARPARGPAAISGAGHPHPPHPLAISQLTIGNPRPFLEAPKGWAALGKQPLHSKRVLLPPVILTLRRPGRPPPPCPARLVEEFGSQRRKRQLMQAEAGQVKVDQVSGANALLDMVTAAGEGAARKVRLTSLEELGAGVRGRAGQEVAVPASAIGSWRVECVLHHPRAAPVGRRPCSQKAGKRRARDGTRVLFRV